jgi:iron complex outermembrane receptor protein
VENFGASNAGSLNFQNSPLPPESAQQWELGIKTQFLDNRLRLTLAYYDLTKQNVRIQDMSAGHDCGGGVGSCTLAAGEVNSHGPELDVIGEILPGWQVIANYANQSVRVNKGNQGTGSMQQGNRLANVPRNIGTIWTTYEFQQGLLQGLKFGGGVSLRDDTTDFNNDYRSPGYGLVSLMSAYSFQTNHSKIRLQLNVDNLLNESYVANVLPQGGLTNLALANYSKPRSFMGLISFEY